MNSGLLEVCGCCFRKQGTGVFRIPPEDPGERPHAVCLIAGLNRHREKSTGLLEVSSLWPGH